MTSDGISEVDWRRVHELAVEIVNCSARGDEATSTDAANSLLALLDELDRAYGPKPSLLATRADYVESPELRERLLKRAYVEAEHTSDRANQRLVAHSLASFYIEDQRDHGEGARWLAQWRDLLASGTTEDDTEEIKRLNQLLVKITA